MILTNVQLSLDRRVKANLQLKMEEPKPNYPNAMAIIEPVNENQSVKLNVESLEHILLNPAIVNKKVCLLV